VAVAPVTATPGAVVPGQHDEAEVSTWSSMFAEAAKNATIRAH
jgi:hypothetical protein